MYECGVVGIVLVHQLAAHNRVLSIRERNVNTAKSTEERVHHHSSQHRTTITTTTIGHTK